MLKKYSLVKNVLNIENPYSNSKTLIVIYSTMPVGMIVGEFKFKTIHANSPKIIWEKTKKYSGISEDFFYNYFKNKDTAFAIEIEKVRKYRKPLDPHTMFTKFTAPQSFCYLEY